MTRRAAVELRIRGLGLIAIGLLHGVKGQLKAVRHSYLVINSEKIVAHCVFANPELQCDLPRRHALGNELHELGLAFGEQI